MLYTSLQKSENEVDILCYGPYVIAIKGPHAEHPEVIAILLEKLNSCEELLLLELPTLRAFVRVAVLAEAEVDRRLKELGMAKHFKGMLKPQGYFAE